MKRDVSVYVHMSRDNLFPLCAPVHIMHDPPPSNSPVAQVFNGWPISQLKNK